MPIRKTKVSYTLNLREKLKDIKPEKREKAKEEIAKVVLQTIKNDSLGSISSVDGKGFKPLSKNYEDFKKSQGKGSAANLRLKGSLMKSLNASISGNKITWGHIGAEAKEKKKSFNHNVGDSLPRRAYLPDDGDGEVNYSDADGRRRDTFRKGILEKIEKVLDKYKKDE
jgi:hypothetical protein